ncbi:MAG: Wzz/FepE/Etk N-terminal domain-containing protein [Myxococcota bacterium]|nr:Wzz/FepE/Etk N-terminal domain-containing protein [Myxococcota bacterium]
MDLEQGFDFADVTRMLRRRAWLIAGIAGFVTLAGIFIASVLPNRFEASATLLVEPQTIAPELVPGGVASGGINSRLHLIQMQILSRGRLSRVIDDLGLYEAESEDMTREEVISLMRSDIRLEPVLPELEESILERQRDIEINTFRLSFRHSSRRTAADVANRLANDFIEQNIKERVEIAGDTSEFIEAELNRLANRIQEVEEQIATVKSENAGRLPEDLESNHRLLERSIEAMRWAARELSIAESDASFFGQQASSGAGAYEEYGRPETSPSKRLESLEIILNEARSRGLTDKHPDVIAVQKEIEALEIRLAGEQAEAEAAAEEDDRDRPLSLAQQNAKAEQQRARQRQDGAQAEMNRLEGIVADVQRRIGETPAVAEQLGALQREHEHLFQSFQDFSNKRLEAAVAANMERRQKGEQFRVLEAAYPPPAPVSPNRPLIIAVGLVLGLLSGAGLAFLMEFSDSSYHSSRRLQEALRIPVLASVPAVVLASDRVDARRRRFRRLIAAAAIASVGLGISIAANWTVNGAPGPVKDLFGGDTEAVAEVTPQGS